MNADMVAAVESVTVGEILTPITLVVVSLGLFSSIKKFLGPTVRNLQLMWEDWKGEEARPGVQRRPGVMERLSDIEHQLKPNGGGSIRDRIDRVSRQLEDHIVEKDQALVLLQQQVSELNSKASTLLVNTEKEEL